MAQLEAARAQQAAEAACIGLTLDEEKITSLSASTRRHLQGLALVVQVGLFPTRKDAELARQPCPHLPSHWLRLCKICSIAYFA